MNFTVKSLIGRFAIAAAALAGVFSAVPASAQGWRGGYDQPRFEQRQDRRFERADAYRYAWQREHRYWRPAPRWGWYRHHEHRGRW